jgi:hypothetical protein
MTDTERFFRAAGYLFTWAPAEGGSEGDAGDVARVR